MRAKSVDKEVLEIPDNATGGLLLTGVHVTKLCTPGKGLTFLKSVIQNQ